MDKGKEMVTDMSRQELDDLIYTRVQKAVRRILNEQMIEYISLFDRLLEDNRMILEELDKIKHNAKSVSKKRRFWGK
jgi:hypothetical protein